MGVSCNSHGAFRCFPTLRQTESGVGEEEGERSKRERESNKNEREHVGKGHDTYKLISL